MTKTQESWEEKVNKKLREWIEAGEIDEGPWIQHEIKSLISQVEASAIARTREEVVEKIEEIETMAGGDPENHIDYVSKEEVLQAIRQEKCE